MLDTFEILTTSGVVLWSKTYATVNPSVINSFIVDVFIEEKGGSAGTKDGGSAASNPPYKTDQHTLKWTFVKELGIIFVVGAPFQCRLATASSNFHRLSTGRFCISLGWTSWSTTSKQYTSIYMASS
jgi:hypothetical protein